MPYTVHFDQEKSCIRVTVTGELTLHLLQEMASGVAKVIDEHGCKRIINDLRQAFSTKAFDVYRMPTTAKDKGVNHSCKRALIVGDKATEFHFLETVFVNQGHQVKIFTTPEEAWEWLLND